jgi:PilZ domain
MAFMRSHLRTNHTEDLSARLRAAGQRPATLRVLNLSEGGMLIAGGELEVGEVVSFEFAGPDFRSAGLAEVAHRTDETTGLRFTRWDTLTESTIRNLIVSRICQQHMESAARSVPGHYLG